MARHLLAVAVSAILLTAVASPVTAGDGSWEWPVDGVNGPPTVARAFDAPESAYGAGHRGIDLGTLVGAPVRAVAPGVVTFAGRVAGTDVVTVDHGTERSTYQPVSASVSAGDQLAARSIRVSPHGAPANASTKPLRQATTSSRRTLS